MIQINSAEYFHLEYSLHTSLSLSLEIQGCSNFSHCYHTLLNTLSSGADGGEEFPRGGVRSAVGTHHFIASLNQRILGCPHLLDLLRNLQEFSAESYKGQTWLPTAGVIHTMELTSNSISTNDTTITFCQVPRLPSKQTPLIQPLQQLLKI